MGRIVDLVKTSPGHHLALLGRAIQLVRITERDCSRRIEPSDLVLAQRDRGGGEVFLKLLPCAGSDNRQHAFGLDPGDGDLARATALTASIAVSLLGSSACYTLTGEFFEPFARAAVD